MNCPSCKNIRLTPTKLETGLPAMSCKKCNGVLLSVLSYRDWVEQQPEVTSTPEEAIEIDNSSKAILCPKCSKIMLKYRVDSSTDSRLDICNDCADVWLDDGEWSLLKLLGLQAHMTDVFSEPWQLKIRQAKFKDNYLDKLSALLGDDLSKVNDFKSWLLEHPNYNEIMHFLKKSSGE